MAWMFMSPSMGRVSSAVMSPERTGGRKPPKRKGDDDDDDDDSSMCVDESIYHTHEFEEDHTETTLVCRKCDTKTKTPYNCPCRRVVYCGTQCQTADWPEHKLQCTDTPQCQVCKRTEGADGEELLHCSCREAVYCGVTCQRQDFTQHKAVCRWISERERPRPQARAAVTPSMDALNTPVGDGDDTQSHGGLSESTRGLRSAMKGASMRQARGLLSDTRTHSNMTTRSARTVMTSSHDDDRGMERAQAEGQKGVAGTGKQSSRRPKQISPHSTADLKDEVASLLFEKGTPTQASPTHGSFTSATSPKAGGGTQNGLEMVQLQLNVDAGRRVEKREAPQDLKTVLDAIVPNLLKQKPPVCTPPMVPQGAQGRRGSGGRQQKLSGAPAR